MSWTRFDVFLSYSRSDSERIQPLLNELRRRGYRVFFDVQSIDPGQQWKKRLDRSIRASRTLILCWSEHARGSDYITFEYSRAEALHKPVFPWLLDETPLPAMLELQGIKDPDGAKVAAALHPYLGLTLTRRRMVQTIVAAVMAIALSIGAWRGTHPPSPPPWIFHGEVHERAGAQMPIAGVEVIVKIDQARYPGQTDAQGKFSIPIPQPQPDDINIQFRKEGYEAENPINVKSGQNLDMDMARLKKD
jgi:hypothetical protein